MQQHFKLQPAWREHYTDQQVRLTLHALFCKGSTHTNVLLRLQVLSKGCSTRKFPH
jgi:hypothetical protein